MKKNWIERNKNTIIRNSFLLPILLVVIMSISHVVSWYDLGNPISWAIYLSVAVEIFALASVSAATVKMNRGSIWFLFGLVTAIQIIGNVFFEFMDIDTNGEGFKGWIELIKPIFDYWSITDHRRLLALIQGGTLPIMSLTSLHYYIKFTDKKKEDKEFDELVEEKEEIKPIEELDEISDEEKEEKWKEMNKVESEEEKEEIKTIEEPDEISDEDYKILMDEINDPKEPNEELKKDVEEYKQYTNDELNKAKELWKSQKRSMKGIHASDLIKFYRKTKTKDIDPKTGKLKKINNIDDTNSR